MLVDIPSGTADGRILYGWDRVDDSDEHLLSVGGDIAHRRSVRRRAAGDESRWQVGLVQAISKTPWDLLTEMQPETVGTREQVTAGNLPAGGQEPEHLRLGVQRQLREAGPAVQPSPAVARPKTAGCSGCFHQGRSRGYHHSMTCRRRYAVWLAQQTAPTIERVPAALAPVPPVKRRIVGKTTVVEMEPETTVGPSSMPTGPSSSSSSGA